MVRPCFSMARLCKRNAFGIEFFGTFKRRLRKKSRQRKKRKKRRNRRHEMLNNRKYGNKNCLGGFLGAITELSQ